MRGAEVARARGALTFEAKKASARGACYAFDLRGIR